MATKLKKIIAVDDNITNLTTLKNILKPLYEVYTATSAAKMFELLTKFTPDLILLDVEMPELNGYESVRLLKNNVDYKSIPVIFITSKIDADSELKGLDLGAMDYIFKPYIIPLLLKRIETHLTMAENKKELQELNGHIQKKLISKMTQVLELKNAVLGIVADLVEFRDGVTGEHISRTEKYLQTLIDKIIENDIYSDEAMSWDMESLLPSAQLHDVGKIAISDAVLNKNGKLTPEEYEIMKTHTQVGVDLISRMARKTTDDRFFEYAKTFAGTHHEKWDGSGYPYGLRGTDIPLEGRLMAIADVYDALVSARPYKEAFSHEKAAEIITNESGISFDPLLVDTFKMIANEFAEISRTMAD